MARGKSRGGVVSSQGSHAGAMALSSYQPHQSEYSGYGQNQPIMGGSVSRNAGDKYSSNQERNVTELLSSSNQIVDLRYDHLRPENTAVETMKKLGMMSGSKQAIDNGITTQTENMLGGFASKTNPAIRLTTKEEDYVLSQLIQKNFEHRRGLSIFQSKTGRSKINGYEHKKVIPPVGLYEHKFNKKGQDQKMRKAGKQARVEDQKDGMSAASPEPNNVDMKYIERPHHHKAITQAFSCFAETQLVDFTKGQTRDEVSFYKNLARTEQAKALGIDIKDYEELIKLHKSGKYIVNFVKVLNPN